MMASFTDDAMAMTEEQFRQHVAGLVIEAAQANHRRGRYEVALGVESLAYKNAARVAAQADVAVMVAFGVALRINR